MFWQFFKKSKWTIIAMAIFSCIMMYSFYSLLKTPRTLPVYNPVDVNPKLVDVSMQQVRKAHRIGDFSLIDQKGQTVTPNTYKDKIYVADFFFTTCPGICPIMTGNMEELQSYFKDRSEVMFLSHSVTPVMDSVPVLAGYALKKNVNYERWRLVTGDKKQIYNLARKHYFAAKDEGDGGVQDFIHTEQFVLIDRKKRIRGYYDGTDKEAVARLKVDIELLLNEFSK